MEENPDYVTQEKSGTELELAINLPDEWNGVEMSDDRYEIILRYAGDIEGLAQSLDVQIVVLTGGYAVGYANREQIRALALSPVVIYLTVGEYYEVL